MPWTEKRCRFTLRFETRSIRMLQNIDTYNFTDIMKLSWNQAWNILNRAVKRERKSGHTHVMALTKNPTGRGTNTSHLSVT